MITKVKHSKGETKILWNESRREQEELIEHEMTCTEMPRPELLDAIKAFIPYVLEICELPKDYAERMSVSAIHLNQCVQDDIDVVGLVVTAQKSLARTQAPMIINTPFLADPGWPHYMPKVVERLEAEALKFRNGNRAQQVLPMKRGA
jgi:hypothetical protein